MKKRKNSDRKNSYFSDLCSAVFTMIIHFSCASIHSRTSFNYGKTGFCISGTLDWNGSSTFQRKISTRKHGSVFSLKIKGAIDAAENKSWVVVTKLSNKLFLSFSNLTSALLILGIALYTYMKFGEAVSELAKIVGLSFFGYSKLNI